MKQRQEYLVNIREKGVTTIPSPIRKVLGTKIIKFVIEKDKVEIYPVRISLDTMMNKYGRSINGRDLEEVIAEAHKK